MEYPLGANSAAGACKPTESSGIQKPALRRPWLLRVLKSADTAQVEVFFLRGACPSGRIVFSEPDPLKMRRRPNLNSEDHLWLSLTQREFQFVLSLSLTRIFLRQRSMSLTVVK